jgi:hypothetical protein
LNVERENPEGESAEQSMESGFSTKGFGSLSSSISGGISPVRNPLPRALVKLHFKTSKQNFALILFLFFYVGTIKANSTNGESFRNAIKSPPYFSFVQLAQ